MRRLKKLNHGTDDYSLEAFACYCGCSCFTIFGVSTTQDSASQKAGS